VDTRYGTSVITLVNDVSSAPLCQRQLTGIIPQLMEIIQCLFHRVSGHSSRDRTSRRMQDFYAVKPPLTETGYKIHPVFHSHGIWSLHFQQTMRDVVTLVCSGIKKITVCSTLEYKSSFFNQDVLKRKSFGVTS